MAIVNPLLNVKDSRWLQLEVCREFQRNKCSRSDTECKFAHPGPNVEIQNGRVIACYDSIKGRCNREKPPCKYFHPPKHLKEQLIINGKNHLALKNALLHQVPFPTATVLAGQLPMVGRVANLLNAYPRNYQLQQPTPPQTCLINPMAAAAFASALNNNGSAPQPPPATLIHNSRITKAPNPYLTNLSAIAAASSAAYGAYPSNPNSAAAAAAAAAMMMGAPDHHHHHHHSHTLPHQPNSYQFNSYGLAIPNSSPSNTVSSVSAAAAAAAAAQAAATINNLNTKARSAPTSTALAVPETNGTNNVTSSAVTVPANTVSLESHSGLAEASSINAVANTAAAAAAAAAAIGRKRTRESNDELLMHISGAYPITKRVAMEKDGTPLYQAPQTTATAYAHPQPFAVHQPLVPLSFYFPLISQANTIPRY